MEMENRDEFKSTEELASSAPDNCVALEEPCAPSLGHAHPRSAMCSPDFLGIPLNLGGLSGVAGQYTEVEQPLGRDVSRV